jgi:hypothetical protein
MESRRIPKKTLTYNSKKTKHGAPTVNVEGPTLFRRTEQTSDDGDGIDCFDDVEDIHM